MGTFSGEIVKGYKLDSSVPEFRGGQSNIFKIQGVTRSSNGKAYSVMVCSKQEIKEMISEESEREKAWQMALAEAKNLLKMKHPSLLRVEDKLFEETNRVVVVVERVEGTLATLFQDIFTCQGGKNQDIVDLDNEEEEARNNIKTILSGLRFINKDLKHCHWGVSPEAVFLVGPNRLWKLGGFGLMRPFGEVDSDESTKPNMYFISPEHFGKTNSRSDLFSFGLVLIKYFLYIFHLRNRRDWESVTRRTEQVAVGNFRRDSKSSNNDRETSKGKSGLHDPAGYLQKKGNDVVCAI